jgi:hypothetical protein
VGWPQHGSHQGTSVAGLVDHGGSQPGTGRSGFTRAGAGQVIFAHNPTRAYGAPDGAVGLTLNYAAPGGAYVTEGRSG